MRSFHIKYYVEENKYFCHENACENDVTETWEKFKAGSHCRSDQLHQPDPLNFPIKPDQAQL